MPSAESKKGTGAWVNSSSAGSAPTFGKACVCGRQKWGGGPKREDRREEREIGSYHIRGALSVHTRGRYSCSLSVKSY